MRKSGHYDAEGAGALGAASGEIFCHLGCVNGFHTQAREQNAHQWKSLETRRILATELEQFDSPLVSNCPSMAISGIPSRSLNTRVNLCFIVLRKELLRRVKEFSLAETNLVVVAEGEAEMRMYLGGSLREDEFFDRGFHQLH